MNKIYVKTMPILLMILTLGKCSSENGHQVIQNLRSFAKLYGYIKYFHPSDEASKINWDKFAIYGVDKVKNVKNGNELKEILDSLFLPVAPTIQIYVHDNKPEKQIEILPDDTTGIKPVFWQHFGVWLSKQSNIYNSIRLNRNGKTENNRLFDLMPQIGELYEEELDAGLSCQFSIVLYSDSSGTLGGNDNYPLDSLLSELDTVTIDSVTADDENIRLANLIITWNVFQHFYPYFDVVDVNWDESLSEALKEAFDNQNANDFFDTLRRMIAKLEDGHGVVYYNPDPAPKGLPIKAEWIESQLVITASKDTSLFKKGDVVLKMDGKSGEEALDAAEKLVSGSPQLRRYRALNIFDSGAPDSVAKLELLRKEEKITIEANRDDTESLFYNRISEFDFPDIKKLEGEIYYINLATVDVKDFNKIINDLADANGVIYDWRWDGEYDRSKERLILTRHLFPHLIEETVRSAQWHIPNIIYPDRKDITFSVSGWPIHPQKPYFKSKSVFINEPSVVSYGETCMGVIEHYKLADMVGQTTAGCNGNANFILLPGGFRIMWTGMKVLKQDGSQHHLTGVQPTYPVKKTIRAVIEGRDEYLEKAIEIIHK